jgi:hypothetical protein
MMAAARPLYVLLAVVGAAIWVVPWLLLDGKEAWDHPSYFSVSIPVMCVFAAYAGYRGRTRVWRWPLTLAIAQFATMLLLEGLGNLFPLGIIAFLILSVPMLLTAWLGAWFARRREQRTS